MAITIEDAKHVANLARLGLGESELQMYTKQLNDILNYAQELQKIDTANIEPTYHSLPMANVLRPDVNQKDPARDKIIQNGPEVSGTSFVVPKIL